MRNRERDIGWKLLRTTSTEPRTKTPMTVQACSIMRHLHRPAPVSTLVSTPITVSGRSSCRTTSSPERAKLRTAVVHRAGGGPNPPLVVPRANQLCLDQRCLIPTDNHWNLKEVVTRLLTVNLCEPMSKFAKISMGVSPASCSSTRPQPHLQSLQAESRRCRIDLVQNRPIEQFEEQGS